LTAALVTFSAPPLTIEIAEGDITAERTDAIVNAANNEFWMGAGVADAIKRHGGEGIEREAMALGPVDPGACVLTSAGKLGARFVIHAAVMGQDLRTSPGIIEKATRNALRLADEHRMMSIALPAFGTGVGGFPLDACARIMIGAVHRFAPAAASLKVVRFVLFGSRAHETFAEVAADLLGSPLEGPPDRPISG
jgi:O-acetyl-ADP-ribose deacetylase (regulator of RNase III)